MAKNKRSHSNGRQTQKFVSASRPVAEAPRVFLPKPPVRYGKPFLLMEDVQKNTFEYVQGAWVAHDRSIADYRIDCKVNELPQKVNKMTRYEIRSPIVE